jgi:NADH-quinone oxidoreductase subunit G/NADP-reducing hydrogenase subunit HndD
MYKLTIDNREVEVVAGTSILNAARKVGIKIPSLCFLEGVHVLGGCRVCVVEVEGARSLLASCALPVADGMKVRTNTPKVRKARRAVVELLLSDHDGECQTCVRANDCELQSVAHGLDIRELRFTGAKHKTLTDTSTPALDRDSGKCVMCRRCITVCNEVQATRALWAQDRGFESVAATANGTTSLVPRIPCRCGGRTCHRSSPPAASDLARPAPALRAPSVYPATSRPVQVLMNRVAP